MYFAHSLGGRLLVGTGHAPVDGGDTSGLADEDVSAMLADLNRAVPGIGLQPTEISHVFWGQLPARRDGSVDLANEAVILDHGNAGGPDGLFSVSGVKFTTARSVASRVVSLLGRRVTVSNDPGLPDRPPPAAYELHPLRCRDRPARIRRARELIENEAPQSLADLLIRRSNLVGDADAAMSIASDCCAAFGWGPEESDVKTKELSALLERPNLCG
jgi:glycerol-3-phosphate dehydrogenase